MKIAGETITDEQVRALRDTLLRESRNEMTCDTDYTAMALWDIDKVPVHLKQDAQTLKAIARAHCAEILNSRNGAAS